MLTNDDTETIYSWPGTRFRSGEKVRVKKKNKNEKKGGGGGSRTPSRAVDKAGERALIPIPRLQLAHCFKPFPPLQSL